MDPSYPATQRLIAVAQMIWSRVVETHTPEQLDEMDRQIEENRRMRQMMFAGRFRPVVEAERSEEEA